MIYLEKQNIINFFSEKKGMCVSMEFELESLDGFKNIHLIGIGGISMSAIAECLKTWGYNVTGSDIHSSEITEKLSKDGINVIIGNNPDIAKKADLIIYNAAISDTDPELLIAKENKIPIISRGKFVRFFN